jgi:hypothetical protein
MKIRAIGLALLLAATAWAGAEAFTVLLNNPEEAVFYFVLDPPELSRFDPGSSVFPSVVNDFFLESPSFGQTAFRGLAAGATMRLADLAEGVHLLVGFFALPGRRDFPVRVLQLKAGGGGSERLYSVYAEPGLLKARAGRGRLAGFAAPAAGSASPAARPAAPVQPGLGELAIRIDNDYSDWEAIPVFRDFTGYSPATFRRELIGGARQELPLEQARFWKRGGTRIAELKLVDNGPSLYVFLSTHSAMAEGLSFYLYFRSPQDLEGENQVTVELLPAMAGSEGLAALWVKGREPAAAGTLASGAFFLEAALDKAQVLGALPPLKTACWLELTAGYHDRASLAYEEFYYARFALGELPTPETLFD